MIYIHIPYCHRKCTYCAFYSAVTTADKQGYVEAICEELRRRRHEQAHPIRTIYFGGGTPSTLTINQLSKIADTLQNNYDLQQVEEVTLEANPEDLTPDYLQSLLQLNIINRLSIGIQSFDDNELHLLNRRHSADQALRAVHESAKAGFQNISIDLIYGLPGQTPTKWMTNLRMLESLPIQHLSAYALTVEEGTMLARQIKEGIVAAPDEEMQVAHYQLLLEWAQVHQFQQYEISNFALPGFHARHNSRYWDRTPYLGAGAAAHSFDGARRRWNIADVKAYTESTLTAHTEHEEEELGLKEAHNEYLMTALRTTAGIEKIKITPPFAARLAQDIKKYVDCGWIEESPTHYRPTAEGLLHADGIAAELFI